MDKTMYIQVISPESSTESIACDDILFQIPDGENGKGAGYYGVRPNFESAIMEMCPCTLVAKNKNQVCFQVNVDEGTINVENNQITVLTENFEIIEKDC